MNKFFVIRLVAWFLAFISGLMFGALLSQPPNRLQPIPVVRDVSEIRETFEQPRSAAEVQSCRGKR